MSKKSYRISVIHLISMKVLPNKGNWSKMTLRYKFGSFAVKLFEDHGIKLDRTELLSLSILVVPESLWN